jgi:hypothetical protein
MSVCEMLHHIDTDLAMFDVGSHEVQRLVFRVHHQTIHIPCGLLDGPSRICRLMDMVLPPGSCKH